MVNTEKKRGRFFLRAKIISVNTSCKKGERKTPQRYINLEPGGITGDAHFGSENLREVSILDWSSVVKLMSKNPEGALKIKISPGDFAENITTDKLEIKSISPGDTLAIYTKDSGGDNKVILKITAIGKKCHNSCPIKDAMGECAMPREGVFASVVKGGMIKPGDEIELIKNESA